MFFELRQYRVRAGQREAWVRLMEEEIIPFQIAQGMVVIGSFVGEQEEDLYVWIRRFESEEAREALYAKVYQSDRWQNDFSPRVGDMLDREKTVVTRLVATPRSVVQ
jgi:NIPSNAP protein